MDSTKQRKSFSEWFEAFRLANPFTPQFEAAGFRLEHTGGGCTAWTQSQDGMHVLVTDEDGGIPEPGDRIFVGVYSDENQTIIADTSDTFPLGVEGVEFAIMLAKRMIDQAPRFVVAGTCVVDVTMNEDGRFQVGPDYYKEKLAAEWSHFLAEQQLPLSTESYNLRWEISEGKTKFATPELDEYPGQHCRHLDACRAMVRKAKSSRSFGREFDPDLSVVHAEVRKVYDAGVAAGRKAVAP